MKSLAEKIAPDAIKKLIPYQSARRIGGEGHLWLNANELEASCVYEGQQGAYHRYPDFLPDKLASAYLEYCQTHAPAMGCKAVAVRGADEAIDLLVRTFCQPGVDKVMVCPPTYAMYEFCADSIAVEALKVPLLSDFQLDMEEIISQLDVVNILFLCSPNNPTGNIISQTDIITLLDLAKDKALVVVDEAYIEFAPQTTVVGLIEQYPNLVVIRTLSKAFGLASVRCGFLLADDSVMDMVTRLIAPYPIADPTAEIALAALTEKGICQMNTQTDDLITIREWFASELNQLEIVEQVFTSSTNFLLVKFNTPICMYRYLCSKGIVTRNQVHEPALSNCVRITIGSQESMRETLLALKQMEAERI
ncbi:histidinol-phosphate transaminase [Photobacterium lutimaris]|uniref:histidinol-phosphate transaminase n=1 Tax=Photobacterium lutimaris TaxID=388278 RepID=A0A2T3IZ35_9GAMM|nr:histidinol-phosphate transaminase [Photobacterium lutimaris]PSU33926.1 histidinol-phosphate transaminase [Photobacterium lutimaris]